MGSTISQVTLRVELGTLPRAHVLCLDPIGDFCIGDGEMYNYSCDASRCLAILSINTSSSDEKN